MKMRYKEIINGILWYGLLSLIVFVTIGYVLTINGEDYEMPLTTEHDSSIPHVTLLGKNGKNVTFHVETFGNPENEPIVFIHGGPGIDYKYLLVVVEGLSKDYFLVFYDQRGTGLSPRVNFWDLNIGNFVDDMEVMIDYTLSTLAPKHSKVHLIGHSWGGIMIPMYITEHFDPEHPKVDKIVLCEPSMLSFESSNEFMNRSNGLFPPLSFSFIYEMIRVFFGFLHVKSRDFQGRFDYVLQKMFLAKIPGSPIRNYFYQGIPEIELNRYSFWSGVFVTLSTVQFDYKTWNFVMEAGKDMKKKVKQKVLLLTSDSNVLIGRDYQEEFHRKLFNEVDIVMIKNAAHFMYTDNTKDSIEATLKYLDE